MPHSKNRTDGRSTVLKSVAREALLICPSCSVWKMYQWQPRCSPAAASTDAVNAVFQRNVPNHPKMGNAEKSRMKTPIVIVGPMPLTHVVVLVSADHMSTPHRMLAMAAMTSFPTFT